MLPETLKDCALAAGLEAEEPSALLGGSFKRGELELQIEPAGVVRVCRYLKLQHQFVRLSGLTAVDRYPQEPRFEVIYLLHSIANNSRVRLVCRLAAAEPEIDSVTGVWRSANFYERETFDLFGIRFREHPDLTRIMMPEDWEGHPLRKDYPVHGHRYSYKNQ